ncbi:Site-specific DNA recombinase [Eubacterium ruminantium]|nr:Site-specific DNA recombinase [Eubacterium ruminantium]
MTEKHSSLRVAAYARVSSNEESQTNSFSAQLSYYKELILSHPDWTLVALYADEGISGTALKNRIQFKRMMTQCRRHRIDLILCKSISRFARNTVDFLSAVRELTSLGIRILFEKENIDTGSINSEFMISLYASFAQAESESISKNITWGIEKAFQSGKVRYNFSQMMGYRLGDDKKPVIIEAEAEIVRRIYSMFADGHSMGYIANILTASGCTRRNGSSKWTRKNVEQILINEKYAGHALLQKSVTINFLTHERIKNAGIKPQYFIKNCHEAIVDEVTYERVLAEFERRRRKNPTISAVSPNSANDTLKPSKPSYRLNRLLLCPYCGEHFRRVIWKCNDKRYAVWRCSSRLEGGKNACPDAATVHESLLHELLITAINEHGCRDSHGMLLTTFDEDVVYKYVRQVNVYKKNHIRIEFRDGTVMDSSDLM